MNLPLNSAPKSFHKSPLRIALIEDDLVYRAYMVGLLKRSPDVEVVHAWDSAEAMLADTRFLLVELLFVDLELPSMSGLELISRLSKLPDPPSCVVLTNSLKFEDLMAAIRCGASGYLVKTSEDKDVDKASATFLISIIGKSIFQIP